MVRNGKPHVTLMKIMIDTRTKIQLINPDGSVEYTHYGSTQQELELKHRFHLCDAWCSYCYSEACKYIEQLPIEL